MAKAYQPPQMTSFGTVSELTAFQGTSARTDYFENTSGVVQAIGTGSRDNCFAGRPAQQPNPSSCQ